MRSLLIVLTAALLLGGCGRGQELPVTTRPVNERASDDGPLLPADALRPQDLPVLDAVLSDFAADPGFGDTYLSKYGRQLVVHRETTGGSAFVRADQLGSDAAGRRLPQDAAADLEARNNGPPVTVSRSTFSSVRRAGAPLDGFKPSSHLVVADDLDRFPSNKPYQVDFVEAFRKAHPTARGFVWAWLPGYSADGRQAIVCLSFGPTAHGATATYLLERSAAGTWKVVWRDAAYYA
jgi:hypothetical protein